MVHRYGEIWLANLNPGKGTEPGKIRPVIILQTDDLNTAHPSTVVCPITSNVIEEADLLRVHLAPGPTGLEQRSDVLIDQIRAIDTSRLLRRLGEADRSAMEQIKSNIQVLLGM
ncbi:MAG TPA: type II toxin-antitoxin system PemK/MazF family toxin [Candidatus Kapabacteria bacterium]|nr:type II toxin-antitoxin system PemK/MazF family toxin [Candidatus Kapabacteria bacterium]